MAPTGKRVCSREIPRRGLIAARVHPTEAQQLRELAAALGMPLSTLIRRGLETQGFKPLRP